MTNDSKKETVYINNNYVNKSTSHTIVKQKVVPKKSTYQKVKQKTRIIKKKDS